MTDKELKQKYTEVKNLMKSKETHKATVKLAETTLKVKMAEHYGFEDKEGKPAPAKIKSGLLKKAIVKNSTGENPLSADLDTMEDYAKVLKSSEIPDSSVKELVIAEESLKVVSSEIGVLKKELLEDGELSPFDYDVIVKIAQEELAKELKGEDLNSEGLLQAIKETKQKIKNA